MPIFAVLSGKNIFSISWQTHTILQFHAGISPTRSRSFPSGQLTFRRVAAGDCGYDIGNTLFSSPVQGVFPAWRILSPSAQGRIYGIIHYASLFSATVLPNLTYFWHSDISNTYFSVPTCCIGLQSCAVWLFNTLFERSEAYRHFLIFRSSKKCFQ
jgi:hypothetical protein